MGQNAVQLRGKDLETQTALLDPASAGGYALQTAGLAPVQMHGDHDHEHEADVKEPPRGEDLDKTDPMLKKAEAPSKDGDKKGATPKKETPVAKPKKEDVTGIASSVAIDRFVTAAKKVQKDWDKLTPEKRIQGMTAASNAELKRVSVPECKTKISNAAGNLGQLDFTTWSLDIGKPAFEVNKMTEAQAADAADTVYHESRHAEQWHRMARIQAGKGKKAEEIKTELGIPANIATDAHGKALKNDSKEAKEGKAWYESVYGGKAAHRNKVLTDAPKLRKSRDEAQKAYEKIKDDPKVKKEKKDQALQKWIDEYNKWKANHNKYMNLPEEADAWKVGGAVTKAYLAKDTKKT